MDSCGLSLEAVILAEFKERMGVNLIEYFVRRPKCGDRPARQFFPLETPLFGHKAIRQQYLWITRHAVDKASSRRILMFRANFFAG